MPPPKGKVEGSVADFDFHGGRLDVARRAYPHAPQPWIDLSTGLNPNPWPVPPALSPDLAALPDVAGLAALEEAAAAAFGTTPDRVAALPGVEIGLRLLATMGLAGPLRRVAPAYGSHAAAMPGSVAITADAVAAIDSGTVLVANPNNPDGIVHPPATFLNTARRLGESGGWLIVDEAFADCDPGISILPLLGDDDRAIAFRSFGKFFGLGGVRLGFACGHPDLVDRFRQRVGSWPVSTLAIDIGTAAYRDTGWAMHMRADLRARAARVDTMLARHGMIAGVLCPLFRLVAGGIDAKAVFVRLARAGILTRPFADRDDWLRFGLPRDDAAFDRLDAALANA